MIGLFRAILLLSVIVLLNIVDLYMTIFHMTSFGFAEANPIANAFMHYGTSVLIAYKVVTVGVGVALLSFLHNKKTRTVAVVSWAMVVLLTSLMLYWVAYTEEVTNAAIIGDTKQHLPHSGE